MLQGYGELLKNAREGKNLKHADVHKYLKIDLSYVRAMEEENPEVFEKPVYMRLFLRTYAKFLKLDPEEIIAMFEKAQGAAAEEKERKRIEKQEILRQEALAENPSQPQAREADKQGKGPLEFTLSNKRNALIAASGILIAAIIIIVMIIVDPGKGKDGADESKGVYVVKQEADIKVIAKARDDVWMKARYGEKEEEFFLKKGEDKKWEDIQKIVFLIGNAAGVEFIVNGDSIGVIGEEGEVINGLVFQVGKNWYIDRGQGFKAPRKPTPTPVEEESIGSEITGDEPETD